MSVIRIPNQRAVIDRRSLTAGIAAIVEKEGPANCRQAVVEMLRTALADGRTEISRRLIEKPSAGHDIAQAQAFLVDQLVRIIHDHVIADVYPSGNRSTGERLSIMAVGGYGRGEMAPHSDVDIAFLTPNKTNAWCEQVIEAILYFLWDLSLAVGHSSRSLDEMVKQCKGDLTIRTAMLEGRYVWGDQTLFEEARQRFWKDVVSGTERQYVSEKLEERDGRHKRMGDSRYVVEPNVKEGKGSLRDLHTLYWIGKYIHRVRSAGELVNVGLLTREEFRSFRRAANFFWAVRCHLHDITGRSEDRLTFDLQREVAKRMQYSNRTGKSAVERFMHYFFLQAKVVGNLTGVFLAQLDEQFSSTKPRGLLAGFRAKPRKLKEYTVFGGRIKAPSDDWFEKDPARLLEIFVLADREGLEVHPQTMRQISRDTKLIKADLRKDKRANAYFMELLTSRNNPEVILRALNEAGVFGRFVLEFGRVNAQMQFDMYHHFTVDEHTIRAIGLLSRIEKGELKLDHPLAHEIIHKVQSRRALYASVLLHDIAKGQGGDHSVLGAAIARKLCPRFGLDADETELVSWLVQSHLLLSSTAQKRDISDPKTISDFVEVVQSLDRLRQLTCLTIVDIRAVGPGTWNSWKRQLIAELYSASEEMLRLGHVEFGREKRIAAKKEAVTHSLGRKKELVDEIGSQFPDAYWIAEPEDVIAINLVHLQAAQDQKHALSIRCEYYPTRGATLVTVIASDHPGLFYRIAGGIHLAGGNVIDARIHTTRKGIAVDNFLVQDPLGGPFMEEGQLERLKTSIENALANRTELLPQLVARPDARPRADAFVVRPRIIFDNSASSRYTVVEVNAKDRPALLNRLAHALFEAKLMVNSAHVATYGERAADTFYVTDLLGEKLTSATRLKDLEKSLLKAASEKTAKAKSKAKAAA
ncbi:MAG: [protein-PII] uridylyltransferase, partial [Sphingomonadaceae bacterium]|nr:[protein-PII] uridylyltransferase [Sphingomonadaceae bacterium]